MTTKQQQASLFLDQAIEIREEVHEKREEYLKAVTMEEALRLATLDATIASALFLKIIMFERRER